MPHKANTFFKRIRPGNMDGVVQKGFIDEHVGASPNGAPRRYRSKLFRYLRTHTPVRQIEIRRVPSPFVKLAVRARQAQALMDDPTKD